MIVLKHIDVVEATKAIEPLKHDYGQVNPFERTNSILVTDTAPNINRMLQIIRYIDQPVEAREEPNIIQIRYAKAADIKKKLEEIIADSQKEQKKSTVPQAKKTGSPAPVRAAPPGVIRARAKARVKEVVSVLDDLVALAERGIIRGKVKIVADDRTNILIIITRPENMKFFDKIVRVLDVETTPDVMVKVIRLEFAQAKDVASMLNDLIGATSKEDAAAPVPGVTESSEGEGEAERSKALRDYVKELAATKASGQTESKLGQLSKDNIKILSDERTNALILMSSRGDMLVLEAIIKDMDMMLSQVLIEVVILEIGLSHGMETGVDWIQRSMIAYDVDSGGIRTPVFSFVGGGGGGGLTPVDATTVGRPSLGSGLTYYFTHFGLNTDAIIKMAARDSNSRILSSPVIVTHDNTEAKIDSSQQRYFYKGQKYVGGGYQSGGGRYEPDVESKDVGIHLTVTPHVNEKKLVLMEINQKIEQLGEEQLIEGEKWPTVNKREFSASIAVRNRETIVLGGLVKTRVAKGNSGIPFLRKIPLLGMLFRSTNKTDTRGEVVVFITPYVMDSPEEIAKESKRRKESLSTEGMWKHGWSDSDLAERKDPEKKGRILRFNSRKSVDKPLSAEDVPYKHQSRVGYAGAIGTGSGEASPLTDRDLDELMGAVEDKWLRELESEDLSP